MRGRPITKKIVRPEWSRQAEQSTVAVDPVLFVEGREGYSRLSPVEQLRLCREIVQTRRRELCLAYENVVMVTAGFKERRSPRTGRVQFTKEPCVILVVRRKWALRTADGRPGALPQALLACTSDGKKRYLCSVPTDVVAEKRFFDTELQAPTGVRVPRGADAYYGNVACAVRVTLDGKRRDMMLSCLHVFSPLPAANKTPPKGGATILPGNLLNGPSFGRSAPVGGAVWTSDESSFDVQLAEITDRQVLSLALDGMSLSQAVPYIRSREDFDEYITNGTQFNVLVSLDAAAGRVVKVSYAHDHPDADGWECDATVGGVQTRITMKQSRLVDLRFVGGGTRFGDSGSPIVTMAGDGGYTLAGMHIAGSPDHSVMLPAWQLFQPYFYGDRVTSIRPIDP